MLTFTDTYTYTPRYQELDFWQEDQLLFDIETTGLSAKYNTIYLIGCAYHKGRKITLLQYLAETPAEEPFWNCVKIFKVFFPLTASVLMKDLSLTAARNCKFLPTLCPISILTSIRHAAA